MNKNSDITEIKLAVSGNLSPARVHKTQMENISAWK